MSRSGYDECCDGWDLIRWRGAVASAIRGKRGQQLLKDLATALDAMPEKKLIAESLEAHDGVCALGCLGHTKAISMARLDPYDYDGIAKAFSVAPALAQEIMYINDEYRSYNTTPEQRWETVRRWVGEQIKPVVPGGE